MTSRTANESKVCLDAVAGDQSAPTFSHSRVMDVNELMAGQTEVLLRHGVELYRLRLTRQNRLILTK